MTVTLSLFAGAGAQFFDNNGKPLTGGKIYTYLAGTTTPAVTYTTNSGNVAHTNPIVLDSAGRVPGGQIWLILGVGYKFVVETSTNVLIATYNNIPSSAQPPAANDADSILYEQGYTVPAGNFVIGNIYRIVSVGTTDFTLIGATENTVGVHFIATGVGAGDGTAELSQTVESKLRQTVSVKDFGAVGDGVTDDTAAIQAAFTDLVGRTVYFPSTPNGYVINSKITVPPNTSIEFEQGAFVDASNATQFPIFEAYGTGMSASVGGGLAAAVPKNTQTITFNSAPSTLTVGDVIVLHNPANGSWNPARDYYRQGEFLIVQSISGNAITVTTQILDTYPGTCEVYKMGSTTCQMLNIKIIGNPTLFSFRPAIDVRYGYGVVLKNIELVDISDDGINIFDTLNFVVEQCRIIKTVDELPGPPVTESNALVVAGQNGSIRDCVLMTTRHPVSVSGGGFVVTRFVIADNCFIGSQIQWAADLSHGHLEFCGIQNSQISNGAILSGQNNFIRGNTITGKADGQVLIQFAEMRSINHEISNNKLFLVDAVLAIECAVAAFGAMTANMQEDGVLRIFNNEIIDTKNTNKGIIVVRNQGSTTQNEIELIGNYYRGPSTSVNRLLTCVVQSGTRFERITIKDNTVFNAGIGIVENWAYLLCQQNLVFQQNNCEAFAFTQGLGYGIVENNQFGGYGATNQLSGTNGQPGIYVSFRNNVICAGLLASGSIVMAISFANEVDSSNNKIGNMDDPNGTTPMLISSGGLALNVTINGDVYYGGPPTVGSNALNPSNFQFQKKVDISTAGTAFDIWQLPSNTIFLPTMVQGRADTNVSATTGNFYAVGVNANDRRVDYGASVSAASSSQYAKNTMLRFMSTPVASSQAVVGGETLALLSVASNADNASIGSNMGGAGQSITVQIAGNLIGSLEGLP